MMKQVLSTVVLVTLVATSSVAAAQRKPEDVIKFRKGAYQVMGWYMSPMGQMVKGQQPFDQNAFVRNATIVEQMSRVVTDAFAPGSDKGDTRARPEIWQQPEKFKEALERFQAEATKMTEVSKQGNPDQIRSQFGTLAKSCSHCHDQFRSK
jgi:cytochrome c556